MKNVLTTSKTANSKSDVGLTRGRLLEKVASLVLFAGTLLFLTSAYFLGFLRISDQFFGISTSARFLTEVIRILLASGLGAVILLSLANIWVCVISRAVRK